MTADTEARLTEAQRRDLTALAERVERLTKPSLRVDLAVIVAIRPRPIRKDIAITERDVVRFYRHVGGRRNFPHYTASLDAVVALAVEMLALRWTDLVREAVSAIGKRHAMHMRFHKADPGELARLMLAATLRALALKED